MSTTMHELCNLLLRRMDAATADLVGAESRTELMQFSRSICEQARSTFLQSRELLQLLDSEDVSRLSASFRSAYSLLNEVCDSRNLSEYEMNLVRGFADHCNERAEELTAASHSEFGKSKKFVAATG